MVAIEQRGAAACACRKRPLAADRAGRRHGGGPHGRLVTLAAGVLAEQAETSRAAMQDELAALAARTVAVRGAMLSMHARAAAVPLEMDRMRLAQPRDGTLIAGHAPAPVRP